MLITIPNLFTKDQVAEARQHLRAAEWIDGRVTAGYQAQEVKRNAQIAEGSPVHQAVGEMVLKGLARSPRFMSAALPLRVFPPMFNSYAGGQTFGTHVDTAIRQDARTGQRIRTDLSATLFLPTRKSMTAANSSSRTAMAPTASSFQPATWYFIRRRVCIAWSR